MSFKRHISYVRSIGKRSYALACAPGDYENWGGGQINKTGWAQSKSGEAPMVKIKDFTLTLQNPGGAFDPPCPTHRAPMCFSQLYSLFLGILNLRM